MRQENRIGKAFDCVRAGEGLKASTKDFLRKARTRESQRGAGKRLSRPGYRLALWAACAMAALFLCIGSYALLWMPVAYVSSDVTPSQELERTRLDRVISGRAYNEDGERVMESVSVRGMRYEDAIEQIIGSDGMQPYLTQDGALTFTVATDSLPKEERLLEDISRSSGCVEHGGVSVRADMSLGGEAHENGLSLGKYLAYQILLRYEPDLTAQDCHDMSMSQIHGRIEEHEHGGNHGNGHGTEHGSGYGVESGDGYETENDAGAGSETEGEMTDEENGHGHRSGHGH